MSSHSSISSLYNLYRPQGEDYEPQNANETALAASHGHPEPRSPRRIIRRRIQNAAGQPITESNNESEEELKNLLASIRHLDPGQARDLKDDNDFQQALGDLDGNEKKQIESELALPEKFLQVLTGVSGTHNLPQLREAVRSLSPEQAGKLTAALEQPNSAPAYNFTMLSPTQQRVLNAQLKSIANDAPPEKLLRLVRKLNEQMPPSSPTAVKAVPRFVWNHFDSGRLELHEVINFAGSLDPEQARQLQTTLFPELTAAMQKMSRSDRAALEKALNNSALGLKTEVKGKNDADKLWKLEIQQKTNSPPSDRYDHGGVEPGEVASDLVADGGLDDDKGRTIGEKSLFKIALLKRDGKQGNWKIKGGMRLFEGRTRRYNSVEGALNLGNVGQSLQLSSDKSSLGVATGRQDQLNFARAQYEGKKQFGEKKAVQIDLKPKVQALAGLNHEAEFGFGLGGATVIGPKQAMVGVRIDQMLFAGARFDTEFGADFNIRDAGDSTKRVKIAKAKLKLNASAGLQENVNVSFGRYKGNKNSSTGIQTKVDLFAGARVAVKASGEYAGVGAMGKIEGLAGIGLTKKFTLKIENGTLVHEAGFGAALGVGGAVSYGFTINPANVKIAVQQAVARLRQRRAGNKAVATAPAPATPPQSEPPAVQGPTPPPRPPRPSARLAAQTPTPPPQEPLTSPSPVQATAEEVDPDDNSYSIGSYYDSEAIVDPSDWAAAQAFLEQEEQLDDTH